MSLGAVVLLFWRDMVAPSLFLFLRIDRKRGITDAVVALGLIALFATVPVVFAHSQTLDIQPAGLIVPLYAYPTEPSWTNLILAKEAYSAVQIIAILNVNNGPGSALDITFLHGIWRLQAVGIVVAGYVWTDNGARPISAVERDMMKWMDLYNVNGVFFDGMSSHASTANYYNGLAKFAMANGFVVTVGNAGGPVDQILVGIFQITCIYERLGMPSASDLTLDIGPRSDFAYISYGVSNLPANLMTHYVSWLWITNLKPPAELYMSLPPFLSQELNLLGGE